MPVLIYIYIYILSCLVVSSFNWHTLGCMDFCKVRALHLSIFFFYIINFGVIRVPYVVLLFLQLYLVKKYQLHRSWCQYVINELSSYLFFSWYKFKYVFFKSKYCYILIHVQTTIPKELWHLHIKINTRTSSLEVMPNRYWL